MPETPHLSPRTDPDRPLWSVVIPVHDCAGYLARALPEVLAQLSGRADAEIVVVDDDSADDPAAVVERLGGGRVRCERNPSRLGAIGTFNRCLELASGQLVHLLHGDDEVLPGFYPAMEDALVGSPALAAVCRVRDITADNRATHTTRAYRTGTGLWADALEALAVSNRVRASGVVVRRSAYEEVGGFRTDLPHAADWDMWTRLAAHGPLVFVDEVLACYRRHAASDTSTRVRSGANVTERVTAIGTVLAYVPPARRGVLGRRAVAYSVVFAARTALRLLRSGEPRPALRQVRAALGCLPLLLRGVPATPGQPAAERPVSVR